MLNYNAYTLTVNMQLINWNFRCHKFGQVLGNQESLDCNIKQRKKHNHSLSKQFGCMYCVKVFETQEALINHVYQMHRIGQKYLEQCTSTITVNHPFTMIPAGPTRSSKTTWVARLYKIVWDKSNLHHLKLHGVICIRNLCTLICESW